MDTKDYINRDIENTYKIMNELVTAGDSETRIAEEKRMFDFIEDYCSREGYEELIVTIRNLRDGTTDNVVLEFDHNNDTWVWSYDWDEGQEFQFIGITPISEVEPKYIFETDDDIAMWHTRDVDKIVSLPLSICNKCGFESLLRYAYCPGCGRYMINSGKPRRDGVIFYDKRRTD